MQKEYGNKIKNATKWSSVTEIMSKLISPIVNMVLARLLAPEAFGVVATITMVISFAEIFTDAGFQKYIVQHEFETEDELNKSTNVAFWTNLAISSIMCIGIFFLRHRIANLVGSSGLGNSISIASVLIIVAAFSSIQMARYKRDFDFKTLFFVRIATSMIPLVITLPLAFVLRNYWALLIGTFANQLFNAIVLTVKSKWRPSFYYSFSRLKEMFSFSAWTLLESISIWVTSYIGIFIVGSYLNDHYLGLYKTSMSTVNSYMSIITAAITPVLFSALSRYQNDDEKTKETYYSFQRLTATLIIPMGVGIYIFSELVTMILLGNQWMEASGFIGLWGLISATAIVYSHSASEVFRSKGQPKISMLLQLSHLIFLVPVLIVFVKQDFESFYTARTLIRLQLVVTAMLIMRIFYKFKFLDTIKNTLPMLISSCVMGAVGYLVKSLNSEIWWQFVCVFICIVTYFTVLLLFPKSRKEIFGLDLVQKILKRKPKISESNE